MNLNRRIGAALGLAIALGAAVDARQQIYWKKDYIPGPDGGPMAAVRPQPADTAPPGTPVNLAVTETTGGSVSLSWSASSDTGGSGLRGYRIFRGRVIVGVVGGTSFTDPALTPSTAYEFRVAAFDGAGNQSALSSAVTGETTAGSGGSNPDPPSALHSTVDGTPEVELFWTAPSGTVDYYEVFRLAAGGTYTKIGEPTSTTYTDIDVSSDTAYAYKVRAVYNGNASLSFSNVDVAATVTFMDATLGQNSTTIRAVHFEEVRAAVDLVRAVAGLSAASWTDSSLSGVTVKVEHLTELRSNLNAALDELTVSEPSYADSSVTTGTTIKKVHIDELRTIVH